MVLIPLTGEVCDAVGIEFKDLLKLEFSISIRNGRIVLEGCYPSMEQQPSSVPNLERSEPNG